MVRLPPGADLVAAAGLPIAFGTAHVALLLRCGLRRGQTLLVLGAAGGVGLAAVQIGRAVGAVVVGVARGARKLDALRAAGADAVVDSSALGSGGLKAAVAGVVPKGVDVVFDPVGGAMLLDALRCVRWGGQVAVIGFASGKIPEIPANTLLVKNISAHGVYWGSYLKGDPAAWRESLLQLVDWMAAGKARGCGPGPSAAATTAAARERSAGVPFCAQICVKVDRTYGLEDAPSAYASLLRREPIGKVLLLPAVQARI